MNKSRSISLACVALGLTLVAQQASAEPRSVKVRPDGSSVDVDYRTNKIKERPLKVESSGTGDVTESPTVGEGATIAGSYTVSEATDAPTSSLPPLDLSNMRLWNWQGLWHASNWDHAFSSIPWRFDHISQRTNGDTVFRLSQTGAPELKAQKQTLQKSGLWEVDVTLPSEASGLDVAPLWLYNSSSKDEVDFEFVGTKGLQLNIHSYSTGKHVQAPVMLPGTTGWSGRRVRFGIRINLDAGRIDHLIDGKIVHTYYRKSNPSAFPVTGLKPIISMWPAKSGLSWAESWLGKWAGEPAAMVVHGYRFTP